VKLLFDENLSIGLSRLLEDVFPGSTHVTEVGLSGKDDLAIWSFAANDNFTIVTKDDDFREISVLRGAPPKLIILTVGNSSTKEVQMLLRLNSGRIEAFNVDQGSALLEISRRA
jgi:predicted nuclease of predicted toxin-antitoxin system